MMIRYGLLLSIPLVCFADVSSYREFDVEYVIARLDRHISLFSKFNKKSKKLQNYPIVMALMQKPLLDSSLVYHHNLTWLYSKKITHERSIKPLFQMWDLFLKQFKMIEPHLMLVETTRMIFSLYKNFFLLLCNHRPEVVTPEDLSVWYDHIEQYTLDETLDVLDTCHQEFSRAMKKYGVFNSPDWSECFLHRWWVMPCVIGSIVYLIAKRHEVVQSIDVYQEIIIDKIKAILRYRF